MARAVRTPGSGGSARYRLVAGWARFLTGLFYRRVEVVGLEHVPARGPLILTANHQNALVDPMLLLATVPRQLVPIAKAPLFRHPLIGPFLHLLGAVPVHRRQEAGDDPTRNEAMFSAAIGTLERGGAVMIFPEGLSHPHPALMPLRTGTARLLLGAEAAAGGRLDVTLLPVGLVFHEPGTFRAGWALVLIGKPVPVEDCVALARTAPDVAVRRLTDRLADALRLQIVEADDRQTLRLLRAVDAMWRAERSESSRDEATTVARMQQVMRAYRYLESRAPGRVADLRRRVEAYANDLELAGVRDRQLSASYSSGTVLRFTLREGLSSLLGFPLALWGMAAHFVPYQLTVAVIRAWRPAADEEATDKIAAAVVLYPLAWGVEAWLAWRLVGGWALGAFLASLLPAGFFALAWRARLARIRREARGFFRFLADRDLRRHLLARRRALVDELQALARLVPESVRSGQPTEE